jgi:hypothetical protein
MIRKVPIKQKKKTCVICGDETYIFSKHRCKPCAMKQDAKPISRSNITIKSKPKPKNKELSTFFEQQIEILSKFRRSEESGLSIPYPTNVNICHLFPKRTHKSVEAHSMNCIFLTWDEHTKLDKQYLDVNDFAGLEKAFPNSWKLIVERMRIVRASVTEKTKFVETFDNFNETLDF